MAIVAESKETLSNIFNQLIKYSENKLMSANLTKTFYIHLKEAGITDAIEINNKDKIYSAKNGKHIYLGVLFVNSRDSQEHIVANIENRKFNIKKYYDWLDLNENTPIKIKIKVLYTCMFPATILYASETWWLNNKIEEML